MLAWTTVSGQSSPNSQSAWLGTRTRWGIVALVLFAGCSGQSTEIEPSQTAAISRELVEASETAIAGESPDSAEADDQLEEEPAFSPPFPSRVELFVPPGLEEFQRTVLAANRTVELKGFAQIDEPKALLLINGVLQALAAGESSENVEVVSIDAPLVTLRRGEREWTDSLFSSDSQDQAVTEREREIEQLIREAGRLIN